MNTSDLTVEILKSIRDEIRQTNQRLDATRVELAERLDALSGRLDRLERRQIETEVRLATELVNVAQAVNGVRELLRDRLDLHDEVKSLDQRVTVLERRTST